MLNRKSKLVTGVAVLLNNGLAKRILNQYPSNAEGANFLRDGKNQFQTTRKYTGIVEKVELFDLK